MDYITGSSGFLGSHLVRRLPEAIRVQHKNIWKLSTDSSSRLFFLSTYGNKQGQNSTNELMRANIHAVQHLLQYVKNFVYISSSSVMLKTQTPYSRTKRAAEEMIQACRKEFCIIRPYSVTGVGEQAEHLIPTLIRSCIIGEHLDFVPWATHDFVDVEDACDAILNLADHTGIFEIGNNQAYTNQQVLDTVERVTGKKANITITDFMRPYDSRDWVCTDLSARRFGWNPKKTLEQSITEMVNAYSA